MGMELRRWNIEYSMGIELPQDLHVVVDTETPVIFDVGGNTGQSVIRFREIWRSPTIISFEPDPISAEVLERHGPGIPNHLVVRSALTDSEGLVTLYRYPQSDLNSIYQRRSESPFSEPAIGQIEVPCTTIDNYCQKHEIRQIDLLKIDVEGAEGLVITGATETLQNEIVSNVLIEITFVDLYRNKSEPLKLFEIMKDFGYYLTGVYHQQVRNNRLGWADILWTRSPD
jgi:FkbM family methyltransferase